MAKNPWKPLKALSSADVAASQAEVINAVKRHNAASYRVQAYSNRELPQLQQRLRKAVARLPRCKKSRERNVLGSQIRSMVTESIILEHMLNTSRKILMEMRNSYQKKTRLYSDHLSRYFCQQIHGKLPLELRDMVYGNLVGTNTVLVASSTQKLSGRLCLPRMVPTDTPAACPTYWMEDNSVGMMRCLFPTVLGRIICQELVEVWYRNTTFYFEDSSLIPAFLYKNPWRFPIEPKAIVRKVRFFIPEGLLRAITYMAQLRRINRRQYILVTAQVGIDVEKAAKLILHIPFLHPRTKVELHVIPGIDFNCSNEIHLEPVQPWEKSQNSLSDLLMGLKVLEIFLETMNLLKSPNISLLLDRYGKCEINRHNAVWSSLGWLAKVLDWGLE